MSECPVIRECAFFTMLLSDESSLAGLFRQRYCRSRSEECARNVVARSGAAVPEDLFPNQDRRAAEIVAQLPVARTA
jgi:hypothetical protein